MPLPSYHSPKQFAVVRRRRGMRTIACALAVWLAVSAAGVVHAQDDSDVGTAQLAIQTIEITKRANDVSDQTAKLSSELDELRQARISAADAQAQQLDVLTARIAAVSDKLENRETTGPSALLDWGCNIAGILAAVACGAFVYSLLSRPRRDTAVPVDSE